MTPENLTTVQIDKELRDELKMKAIKEKTTLLELVDRLLRKGLAALGVLLLFVSCSSKQYVKVDEVNYGRFQHSQKFVEGMTMRQALDTFGSPQIAEEKTYLNKGVIWWTYKDAIFCNHRSDRCHIGFRNGRAIMQVNMRMEFDNSLVNVE